VLNELQNRFGIEVIAWRLGIGRCQEILRESSFPGLWGTSIAFPNANEAVLMRSGDNVEASAFVILPLDPHLRALALDDAAPPELQLPLFAAIEVRR
jgi:hypothetical protein